MAQIKDSGDEIEDCVAVMKDGFLRDSFDLRFVLAVADKLIDALKHNVSEARWIEVKARIFDMVVAWQKEKGQNAPQPTAATHETKIRWLSDPRDFGLHNQEGNDDDLPWQQRQPWATIKTYLPPAMIDTDEKEERTARRIGFLLGLGAEKAAMAAIREYGAVGGAGLVAMFAWAYQYMRRNS